MVLAAGAVLAAAGLVLAGEVLWVVTRDYLPPESAPPVGVEIPGTSPGGPVRVVVLGDSTGAGVGATETAATVGARLAAAVAEGTGRGVALTSVAVSGARTTDLAGQIDRVLDGESTAAAAGADGEAGPATPPDVAVILIGSNDATHVTPLSTVRDALGSAVGRLTDAGVEVVVGTAPDLGAATAFPQPLRAIVGWRGDAVAEASREAVLAAGGTPVDLAAKTGPAFRAYPDRNLSADDFHPSDAGYARWADALAPAVLDAAATGMITAG